MSLLLFRLFLTLSLAGNATLVWMLWGQVPSVPAQTSEPSTAAMARVGSLAPETAEPGAAGARTPLISREDRALMFEVAARFGRKPALGEPSAVAAWMYREGYPEQVVISVVASLFDEWLGHDAIMEAAKKGDREARRLQAIFSGGGPLQIYMRDVFPSWREGDEKLWAHERQVRFGDLALEKVLVVERMEKEWRRVEVTITDGKEREEREAVFHAALGAVLTPEQVADYRRFNSEVARKLQAQINSIEIDEPTYDRLLAVATVKRKEHGGTVPVGYYRGILSDAQLMRLIPRLGSRVNEADRVYDAAGLSETQRVEFFVMADLVEAERDKAKKQEDARVALAQIRGALAASPENAAKFEASQTGRMLKVLAE